MTSPVSDEAVGDPEMQAILALCHHNPMKRECPQCQFRTAAAIEHITALCHAAIESLETK